MHDGSIMLTGEDVTSAAHVTRKLINLVDILHNFPDKTGIAQIADNEFVGVCSAKLVLPQINAAHPISFQLEAFHQVATNKTAGTIN